MDAAFGPLVFATCIAIIVVLAAIDVHEKRVRRKAWQTRIVREGPRRAPGRLLCFLTALGHYHNLETVPLRRVQQLRRDDPCIGVPALVARNSNGEYLCWPTPAMAGHVVELSAPPQRAPVLPERRTAP